MLFHTIKAFLAYCNTCNFSSRSTIVFANVLGRFDKFISNLRIKYAANVKYPHLLSFVISGNASIHTKKQRVWALRQFFHFLKLKNIIGDNIATRVPYPKIDKKEPDFLTVGELKTILRYFLDKEDDPNYTCNLIIVLFLVFFGLRVSSVIDLDISDINFKECLLVIHEKGARTRILPMPNVLVTALKRYLYSMGREVGPLFMSARNIRISKRMVQHLFSDASRDLGMNIHSHLFRHSAATCLNRIAGLEVTQYALGHRRMENTKKYVHLNPDLYAEYMKRHPYMSYPDSEDTHE